MFHFSCFRFSFCCCFFTVYIKVVGGCLCLFFFFSLCFWLLLTEGSILFFFLSTVLKVNVEWGPTEHERGCVGHNNRDAACYDQRLMFGQSQGLECVFPQRRSHRGFQTQSKESFSPMLIIPSRCADRLSVLCLWRIREAVRNPARVSGCID